MKCVGNDMSHWKLTHLPLGPVAAPQHLSVLLEDDDPVSLDAYSNFITMLIPCSTVVLSHSPEQTHDFCSTRTFDLLIIDNKVPTLNTATIELLSLLSAETSVVIISAVSQHVLNLPTAMARVKVIQKPLRIKSFIKVLNHRSDRSGG